VTAWNFEFFDSDFPVFARVIAGLMMILAHRPSRIYQARTDSGIFGNLFTLIYAICLERNIPGCEIISQVARSITGNVVNDQDWYHK
jgi:hypothetical protein